MCARDRLRSYDGLLEVRKRRRGRLVAVFAGSLLAVTSASSFPGVDRTVPGPVPARVVMVIDGDTLAVRARIWIGQDVETRVRVVGVDTPELRGACSRERELAVAARAFVIEAIGSADVTLAAIRYDKFGGRVLASVHTASGADLATLLIDAGLGRPYDGAARGSWCEVVEPSP